MSHDDEWFAPEDIDVQIDLLTRARRQMPESAQPAERLVSDLRRSYQHSQQQQYDPLSHAWKRIVAGHQAAQHTSQSKGRLIFMENHQSEPQHIHTAPKKRPLARLFGALAAVLFIGLLVGGMVLALNANRQHNTPPVAHKQTLSGSGGTPIPTPAHPITGGKCTIDTTHPHAQQSQSNLPGLYIFAFNSEQTDNLLYRYDPQTKKVVWSSKLCSSFQAASTIVQNGILYLAGTVWPQDSHNHAVSYLYALNQGDGSALWGIEFPANVLANPTNTPNHDSSPTELGMIEPPTLVDNILYVVQRSGKVYAYNATTGAHIWTFDSGRNAWATTSQGNGSILDPSSVQVVNGIAYFSIVDRVFALDAKTGVQVWTHDFKNTLNINQGPAIDNGTVYVTAFVPGYGSVMHPDTYVYAFDAQLGTRKWVSKKLAGYLNAPLAYNGSVAVTSYDGAWYTLDPSSGALKGQRTLSSGGYGTPFFVNGILYNLSGNGSNNTLTVLNADGSTKWAVPVSGAYPNLDDVQGGIIYISGRGSGVYAYSANDGHLLWHYVGYRPQPEGILSVTIVP